MNMLLNKIKLAQSTSEQLAAKCVTEFMNQGAKLGIAGGDWVWIESKGGNNNEF